MPLKQGSKKELTEKNILEQSNEGIPKKQALSDAQDSARIVDNNKYIEIKNNPISKSGVFQYSGGSIGAPDRGRIYNVYRPEEELNNSETIESFKLIPVVDDHTMLGEKRDGLTAPEEKGIHGVLGENVFFEDGRLFSNLKLFSDKIKGLIQSGKKDLSAGFRCMYEKCDGVFEGTPYQYIQRNIRGNHLALVQEGRMGPEVSVLDHRVFAFDQKEVFKMDEVKIMSALDAIEETVKKLSEKVDELVKTDKEVHASKDECLKDKKVEDEEKKEDPKEDKKAEDEDEDGEKDPVEKKAEDEDPKEDEKKEDKKEGMDSAEILNQAVKMLEKKNNLVQKLSPHIGAFDHSEMNIDQVAKYGAEKIGLDCADGSELSTVSGYLHGRVAPSEKNTFDSKRSSSTEIKCKYFVN